MAAADAGPTEDAVDAVGLTEDVGVSDAVGPASTDSAAEGAQDSAVADPDGALQDAAVTQDASADAEAEPDTDRAPDGGADADAGASTDMDAEADAGTDAGADAGDSALDAAEATDADAPDADLDTQQEEDGTGPPPLPVYDCADIPLGEPELTVLTGPLAGRGLALDALGFAIGVSEPHLTKSTYSTPATLLAPNLGELDQIDILPDGDYALAHFGNGSLLRVTPTGHSSVIATDVDAYGLRVGPDGLVYTANGSAVLRVDPATGTKTVLLQGPGLSPRVLDFSPDLGRMYIGTMRQAGTVWAVDLDDSLTPESDPEVLVHGLGDWHDGLGVDICGNIYVVDYETLAIYRISPDGTSIETVFQASLADKMLAHGIVWGSGAGGFHEDAVYIPQPMNGDTVAELQIGVPYRTWDGTVLNAP